MRRMATACDEYRVSKYKVWERNVLEVLKKRTPLEREDSFWSETLLMNCIIHGIHEFHSWVSFITCCHKKRKKKCCWFSIRMSRRASLSCNLLRWWWCFALSSYILSYESCVVSCPSLVEVMSSPAKKEDDMMSSSESQDSFSCSCF